MYSIVPIQQLRPPASSVLNQPLDRQPQSYQNGRIDNWRRLMAVAQVLHGYSYVVNYLNNLESWARDQGKTFKVFLDPRYPKMNIGHVRDISSPGLVELLTKENLVNFRQMSKEVPRPEFTMPSVSHSQSIQDDFFIYLLAHTICVGSPEPVASAAGPRPEDKDVERTQHYDCQYIVDGLARLLKVMNEYQDCPDTPALTERAFWVCEELLSWYQCHLNREVSQYDICVPSILTVLEVLTEECDGKEPEDHYSRVLGKPMVVWKSYLAFYPHTWEITRKHLIDTKNFTLAKKFYDQAMKDPKLHNMSETPCTYPAIGGFLDEMCAHHGIMS